MPNNIIGGRLNLVVAKKTVAIDMIGINSSNTRIIFESGDSLNSYVPGRSINGFLDFVQGKGYYFNAIIDMDLSQYFAPPLTMDPIFQLAKPITSPVGPLSLSFSKKSIERPIDFMPDKFNIMDYDFRKYYGYEVPYQLQQNVAGTYAAATANTAFSLTSTTSDLAVGTVHFNKFPKFAFWAMEAEMPIITGSNSTTYRQALIGLVKDNLNHVGVAYLPNTHQLVYVINIAGVGHVSVNALPTTSAHPTRLRVACTGVNLKAWAEYADGTTYEAPTWDCFAASSIDLRNNTFYDGSFNFGISMASDTNAAFYFNRLKAGYFGYTALRDFSIINTEEGDPMIVDNEIYLSATFTGFSIGGPVNYFKSYAGGVCKFNLSTHKIEQVSYLCLDNNTNIYGLSAVITYLNSEQRFYLMAPSFHLSVNDTAQGTKLAFVFCDNDIKSGVHIFDASMYRQTPPDNNEISYDGSMVKIGAYWYIGYTYKNLSTQSFYNFKLVKTMDFVTYTTVVTKPAQSPGYEGFKIVKIGGSLYWAGAGVNNVIFYAATTGNLVGTISQLVNSSPNPANHPAIFPFTKNGKTYYGWIGMDGVDYNNEIFSYGNVLYYESNQSQNGYDSPIQKFLR